MTKITYIPSEIANAAIDEHGNRKPVTRTQHIFDDALGKPQSEVNQDRIEDIAAEIQRAQGAESTLDGKIGAEKTRAEGVEGGLNTRLQTVEQLAEISIGGGDAQIATGADFTNPDATKRAKIPTVGAIVDGLNDGVYDVSKRNPTAGPNSDGKFTLDYILSNADTLIPTGWRHGGMIISFVDSSDNNYAQFRCKTQSFSANPEDWYFEGDDTLVENPEYLRVIADGAGHLLGWIRKSDGGVDWAVGVPKPVKDYVGAKVAEIWNGNEGTQIDGLNKVVAFLQDFTTTSNLMQYLNDTYGEYIENPEFVDVKKDSDDKITEATKKDGGKFFGGDVEVRGEMSAEEVSAGNILLNGDRISPTATVNINSIIEDPEGRLKIETDAESKIISYRKPDGTLVENIGIETNSLRLTEEGMTEFQQALKDSGFNPGGTGDWSDYISNDGEKPLHIPEPRLALVNISGIASMPTDKGSDRPCVFEMWDNQGNYFKKNAIIDDQGNTTRMFPKHNFAIDLFDSEVGGDAFKLKVGDWVPQDSFHFKAQYTDFFRGISMIAYKIVQEVNNSRSPIYGNPWKKALLSDKTITSGSYNNDGFDNLDLQTDTGAKCIPDGFPCIVYLNGTFYGVFNWALKKSRDNYHQKKDNPLNIHLDGGRPPQMQPLDWTKFEVRNPSYLVYAVPVNGSYKYDADIAQAEIAGLNTGETALSWDAEDTYSIGDIVSLNNRLYLSKSNNNIGNNPSAASYGKKPKDVYSKSNAYWIEITYTNTVKQAVIGFNTACNEVNTLSGDTGKEYLSTHFDVDNLIDFYLCQLILADEDVYANYQWITYDGIKWWLTDYDKDRTFGQIYMCPGVRPASEILVFSNILTTTWSPFKFLLENYVSEIKTRYTELRSIIFTEEHIIGKIKDWMARIGTDNLKREFERWPESPCNRDSKIDREHWEVFNANYSVGTADTYDNTAQYHVGDSCYYSAPGGERHTKFKCIKDSLGNPPITGSYNYIPKELGYYDSLWRVITFVHERIPIIDDYVNSLS